jgi:hypothetical protein
MHEWFPVRTRRLNIRLTTQEHSVIELAAIKRGLRPGTYARQVLLAQVKSELVNALPVQDD